MIVAFGRSQKRGGGLRPSAPLLGPFFNNMLSTYYETNIPRQCFDNFLRILSIPRVFFQELSGGGPPRWPFLKMLIFFLKYFFREPSIIHQHPHFDIFLFVILAKPWDTLPVGGRANVRHGSRLLLIHFYCYNAGFLSTLAFNHCMGITSRL